jgi:hypothetical protein
LNSSLAILITRTNFQTINHVDKKGAGRWVDIEGGPVYLEIIAGA